MEDYRKLYFSLFAALADISEAIENQNYGAAKALIVKAQQQAEEAFLASEE